MQDRADELFKKGQKSYGDNLTKNPSQPDESQPGKSPSGQTVTQEDNSDLLKMTDVQALPDDVDSITAQMKTIDFSI